MNAYQQGDNIILDGMKSAKEGLIKYQLAF